MTDELFQWRNRQYVFPSGILDVKCIGVFHRFYITDFDRHIPTTTVIATDTYDCFNLAKKQYHDFIAKARSTPDTTDATQ